MNDLEHREDFYIPFAETNHNNPYDNPVLHKVEDILGYKLSFFPKLSKTDRRYLKAKRKELKEDVCDGCIRITNNFTRTSCNGCRVLKVKQTLTRVTKLPFYGRGMLASLTPIPPPSRWDYLKKFITG